jgi:hypothetical protein
MARRRRLAGVATRAKVGRRNKPAPCSMINPGWLIFESEVSNDDLRCRAPWIASSRLR